MPRTIIATPHAPAAIGPYSQAVSTGTLIYTSGQLGLDPATGKLAEGVEAQARQVMANLAAVLAAAGSSLDQVVKTTIFLQNMADFAAVNAVYGASFSAAPPARSTVQVAGLPLGGLVEIEAIALAGE
jgi:2-iminobutanoate/2-iminopropanoate deaminase